MTNDPWPAVLLVLHQPRVADEGCGEEAARLRRIPRCHRFGPVLPDKVKSRGSAPGSAERRRWPAGGASSHGNRTG